LPENRDRNKVAPDRRKHRRYEFQAKVELADKDEHAIRGGVSNIGQQGFFVTAKSQFAVGTAVTARLESGAEQVCVEARVIFSLPNHGMGLLITRVPAEFVTALDGWLAKSREATWFSATRRKSQRVLLRVPVQIRSAQGVAPAFEEETHTLQVSAHGALVAASKPLTKGQKFLLKNLHSSAVQECVVAYTGDRVEGRHAVGLEFSVANPQMWSIEFPPDDWKPRG
jgi:hypothetical protein